MKTSRFDKRKRLLKSSALESMEILFNQALERKQDRPDLSRKYIKSLFDISKSYKARVPDRMRFRFCRKCFRLWPEGAKVSEEKGLETYRCACGYVRRKPAARMAHEEAKKVSR
ncbi:MAG: hypothetical protein ACP5NX_01870 [Candidatus Bilamarchaeaceae archaeon]